MQENNDLVTEQLSALLFVPSTMTSGIRTHGLPSRNPIH